MEFAAKRWIVLAASCLINLCIGSLYAWSVFAAPMAEYLEGMTGAEIPSLSLIFTVANGIGPITMISGGFINDRLGPKWITLAGGVLFGAGMILSGFANSFAWLMLSYGICVGLGVGMVYGCTVSNAVKFFPDKRGLAGGITTAAYGVSSVLIPPLANMLIDTLHVTAAFQCLGTVMMILICVCAFLIAPRRSAPLPGQASAPSQASAQGMDWRAMLRTPVFYVMLIIMCCGAFSGLMVISQASLIAQRMVNMTAAAAAAAVSILALFNTAGRIAAGFASDRLGIINTIALVLCLSAAGLATLWLCNGSTAMFYAGLCIVGLSFGSIMGIYPGFTAAQFGSRHNSVNYGIMFIGFASAGYFGPTIMSTLYETTGGCGLSFLIAAGLSLVGFALTFVLKRLSRHNG